MPIVHYNLETIVHTRSMVHKDRAQVLCLSHPDVIVSQSNLTRILGSGKVQRLRCVEPSEATKIIRWHKGENICGDRLADTLSLFDVLDADMTTVDIEENRGGEIWADMNYELDKWMHARFDLVFDCISNQVFNLPQCLENILTAVKVGGFIIHCVPATMLNQGFYNISPTLFRDWYAANGCDVLTHRLVRGVYVRQEDMAYDPYKRIRNMPDDVMHLVVAKCNRHTSPTWPIMTKFKNYPTCSITADQER